MTFHSALLLFTAILMGNNTGYAASAKEKYDACNADAQKKYDSCLVLANELIKESGRTRENEMGQQLLSKGCSEQLKNDLAGCQAASPEYLKKQSVNVDPRTNPDRLSEDKIK